MGIFICFCIIFILLLVHTIWPKYVYDPQYEELKVVDILKSPSDIELNTGDIIFVKNCTKCKYNGDISNDVFCQFIGRNMFNSFRWYCMDRINYTHVAMIVKIDNKPYICHKYDRSSPPIFDMVDEDTHQKGITLSDLDFINSTVGAVHIYRYTGPEIVKDMKEWVDRNSHVEYPKSIFNVAMANALKYTKNPTGVMACTDFIENTLAHLDLLDKKYISNQSTIKDIYDIIQSHKYYEHVPMVLKNNCHDYKHFD